MITNEDIVKFFDDNEMVSIPSGVLDNAVFAKTSSNGGLPASVLRVVLLDKSTIVTASPAEEVTEQIVKEMRVPEVSYEALYGVNLLNSNMTISGTFTLHEEALTILHTNHLPSGRTDTKEHFEVVLAILARDAIKAMSYGSVLIENLPALKREDMKAAFDSIMSFSEFAYDEDFNGRMENVRKASYFGHRGKPRDFGNIDDLEKDLAEAKERLFGHDSVKEHPEHFPNTLKRMEAWFARVSEGLNKAREVNP